MKIAYIEKRFTESSSAIIQKANEIIDEYRLEGLYLTLRQLFYQFVSRDLIPNEQKSYKRIGSIISDARLAGLVDWGAIEDRTRNVKGLQHWDSPGQIIRAASRGFRLDHWEGQDFVPEVWIEKEALVGVIEDVCNSLDVSFFACKGYVSQSEMWGAAQRFQEIHKQDQTPMIIYLGDHDPSGVDMTNDITGRQEMFGGAYVVKRIALNMDQIEEFKPPPNPAKLTDSRCKNYIEKYGRKSWELDALEPRILRDLIEKTVKDYRDDGILQTVLDRENEHKDILSRVERDWKEL